MAEPIAVRFGNAVSDSHPSSNSYTMAESVTLAYPFSLVHAPWIPKSIGDATEQRCPRQCLRDALAVAKHHSMAQWHTAPMAEHNTVAKRNSLAGAEHYAVA